MIPYGKQHIDEDDIRAVVEVLRSPLITQGPAVERFEGAIARRVDAQFGVAVNSATSALHLACRALGLGAGGLLWTSPISFVASANCARYCGADVDFVDIDRATGNMSVAALREKLKHAERIPDIVVPVHMTGLPCDIEGIAQLAEEYGFRVLEDASHALGARYNGVPVGACQHSDIAVFSFHPVKIITSAEGGLATTNHPELAATMRRLRTHGITKVGAEMTHVPDGAWYYEMQDLGFNYRLSDIHAALGLSQLGKLEPFTEARERLAKRYDAAFQGLALELPARPAQVQSAWHLYVVRLKDASRHGATFHALREKGILVNLHYIPIYRQPYYSRRGHSKVAYPESEAYYREAISLPLYVDLSEADQDIVIDAMRELVGYGR